MKFEEMPSSVDQVAEEYMEWITTERIKELLLADMKALLEVAKLVDKHKEKYVQTEAGRELLRFIGELLLK